MAPGETDDTDHGSRVTEGLIERIEEAHPDYTLTSHIGPDGHQYVMLQFFDEEPNHQASSDFVSMVSNLECTQEEETE